jgi:hypothetical protein
MVYLQVLGALALSAGALLAQDPRATITGQVTDASGAMVAGALVRAINSETGTKVSATTNSQGTYEIPFLLPGTYKVEVELAGFKTWTRSAVELRMEDRQQVDARLEVGSVDQSIEVTAETPLLEAANASVAQVVGTREVSELPLRGASIAALYATAPGVLVDALTYDGPWNIAQNSSVAVAGVSTGGGGVDFRLDGISNNSYSGQTAFVPPADMVQEVRISTNTYDASAGHSMGGGINVSLKSGTNALHGSAGALGMAGPLLTRNFFVNKFIFDPTTGPITEQKIHDNTPSVRWLRYSAVVGGPVVIPKVYDGHNRTFWIFGMQIHNRKRPISGSYSVPTAAQREGNFSNLLPLGATYQIYDPLSGKSTSATRYNRSPFPNNVVPASRIDPVGKLIAGLYPLPNAAGSADGTDNFFRTRPEKQDLYQPEGRVDHYFSERHRMFARYTHSDFHGHFDQIIPGSDIRGRRRRRPHRGFALDNVFVLGSGTVLDVRYGFTWFQEFEDYDNQGYDLTKLGFPKSLIAQMDPRGIAFPQVSVTNALQLGQAGGLTQVNYSHNILTTLNWVRGRHALKAGVDVSGMYDNTITYGNVASQLQFAQTYTRGPVDNSASGPGYGQGMASLLLGIPSGGLADINDSRADVSRLYAVYLQDDWRVSTNLTLNLGIRYEYESPVTERFNRSARDFDAAVTNPIQNAVQAQYAKSPIAELATLRTPGGITFVGVGGNPRGFRDPYWKAVMPRVGLAWKFHRRAVMRTGYGIFFAPIGADFSTAQQPGFNQQTALTPSLDGGLTFAASVSNPFPGGLATPAGSSAGLLTYVGRAPGFFPASVRRAYNQRWSYTLQAEPTRNMMVEFGYIGSRAVALPATTDFNPVPRNYLSTWSERDAAAINLLTANVANPFLGVNGFQGSSYYTAVNLQRAQLLKPFPQFTGLTAPAGSGMSWYHAFTARIERRYRRGFRMQASYTHSRTLEAVSYLNPTDAAPEHVLAAIDRPNRISASGTWELPFGRGKAVWSGAPAVVNQAIGGWQLQSLWQNQTGPGLTFGNVLYRGEMAAIALAADQRAIQRWFNTSGFEKAANLQLANNVRMFPSRISGARAGGISTVDVSLFKTFTIRDRLRAQFRCEAEGIANHPNFAAPNTSPTAANFGQVTQTQTQQEERRVSLGLKLLF